MSKEFSFSKLNTGEQGKVTGYCIKWNSPAFAPQIGKKELFTKDSIQIPKHGVPCYFNHKESVLLGNSKSNTLRLKKDDVGLYFELDLPESQKAVRESCSRGDIQGASVSFFANKESFVNGTRQIESCTLDDISLVSVPTHETPIHYRKKGKPRPRVKWSKLLCEY